MAYIEGNNRLVYQAPQFQTGLTISVNMYGPDWTKSGPFSLTEFEEGLYYFDFNFTSTGAWTGIFYENGTKKLSNVFRVESPDVTGVVRYVK